MSAMRTVESYVGASPPPASATGMEEALLKYSNPIHLEDDLTIIEIRFSKNEKYLTLFSESRKNENDALTAWPATIL